MPLARCPEVIEAQRQHVRLLRRCPSGAQAFEVARAVTGFWWEQPWPGEEHVWPSRLKATHARDHVQAGAHALPSEAARDDA